MTHANYKPVFTKYTEIDDNFEQKTTSCSVICKPIYHPTTETTTVTTTTNDGIDNSIIDITDDENNKNNNSTDPHNQHELTRRDNPICSGCDSCILTNNATLFSLALKFVDPGRTLCLGSNITLSTNSWLSREDDILIRAVGNNPVFIIDTPNRSTNWFAILSGVVTVNNITFVGFISTPSSMMRALIFEVTAGASLILNR